MNKTLKTILIIVGGIVLGSIILVLIGLLIVKLSIGKIADEVSDKIEKTTAETETRNNNFKSINDELLAKGLISNNWEYVGKEYGWSFESINKKESYYFYIDNDIYDYYKNYWLEDVDTSDYCTDEDDSTTYKNRNFNKYNTAQYVFHSVRTIEQTSGEDGWSIANVQIDANTTYYWVRVYNKALYYKEVSTCNHTNETYITEGKYDTASDSEDKEYVFYKVNNEWIIKEIIR